MYPMGGCLQAIYLVLVTVHIQLAVPKAFSCLVIWNSL